MVDFKFGDIVLLNFPFADGEKSKKRPTMVILDSMDGDILVCRITSKIYTTRHDLNLLNWGESGLILPSVVRMHKAATINKSLVERKIGELNTDNAESAREIFYTLVD